MKNIDFKLALKEAAEWYKYATEYELSEIPLNEAKEIVLARIFDKYKMEKK